ncbi:hypothetical protein DZF91_14080 [Actinomadura logoneensis]|uniref:Uncharacterized protein n=1 Tax=Actinomadura logoneensis TaxID=2293572 RepID=A0A372JLZ7_9ACTN|nr:hypothetical protein [Actinomadura logoneensis]RFU41015.1 hypothetical protein DZF91_14080 [Actinomadura logoneensis]
MRFDLYMPISPPPAAQPFAETVPHLFRMKSSLVKRWSHTRMRELYEEFDLATFLWSLDREPEALEILDSIAAAIPESKGDYNVWSPVVSMHALRAHILRNASAPAVAEDENSALRASVRAVLADPGLGDNPSSIASEVTEAEDEFRDAASGRSRAAACRNLSRTLCSLFVLAELALARHPYSAYYNPSEPARLILKGRTILAATLTS